MKNFLLLLVLISGLVAGYFVGDYRGKAAREALDKMVATEKKLNEELQAAVSKLQTDLDDIGKQHQQEIAALRKSNDSKVAEWRRTKAGLEETIRKNNAKLAEADDQIKIKEKERDAASGEEKAKLNQEIASLKKEREVLVQQNNSTSCLQSRIPQSVFDALKDTNAAGRK